MNNALNIGLPPKKIKNRDAWTWRTVKYFMKKAKKGDEIGFIVGRVHWVLKKSN